MSLRVDEKFVRDPENLEKLWCSRNAWKSFHPTVIFLQVHGTYCINSWILSTSVIEEISFFFRTDQFGEICELVYKILVLRTAIEILFCFFYA